VQVTACEPGPNIVTMWIETDNESLQSFYNAEICEKMVEFSDSGKAQVSADVGEQLIEQYDDFSKTED